MALDLRGHGPNSGWRAPTFKQLDWRQLVLDALLILDHKFIQSSVQILLAPYVVFLALAIAGAVVSRTFNSGLFILS